MDTFRPGFRVLPDKLDLGGCQVVVQALRDAGYAHASESDRTYLTELRRRFQLPVYYSRFSSENSHSLILRALFHLSASAHFS